MDSRIFIKIMVVAVVLSGGCVQEKQTTEFCLNRVLEDCDGGKVNLTGTMEPTKGTSLCDIDGRDVEFDWGCDGPALMNPGYHEYVGKKVRVVGVIHKGGEPCPPKSQCIINPTSLEIESIEIIDSKAAGGECTAKKLEECDGKKIRIVGVFETTKGCMGVVVAENYEGEYRSQKSVLLSEFANKCPEAEKYSGQKVEVTGITRKNECPPDTQCWGGMEIANIESMEILAPEVTVSTDKTEYGQGENVKVTISNGDKLIYVSYAFDTGVSLHQLKENVWEKLIGNCETNCIIVCENDTLKPGPCIQVVAPLYYYYEYSGPLEIQWNQKECTYETRLCGNVNYSEGSLRQVSAGKFKIRFCYFNKEDIDLTNPPGNASPDKRKCVEKKVTIKEKQDEKSCEKDIDCVLVNSNCCPCSMGGGATCINKGYQEEWNQKLDCKPETECPAVYNCHDISTGCECINNNCGEIRE